MLLTITSCGGNADDLLPITQGGAGTVIALNVDGGHDARVDASGSTGHGGSTGIGGASGNGAGGQQTSTAGTAGGASTGSGGSTGTSGAGGSGPPDDPCTACEKARCSHPAGLADPTDPSWTYYAIAAGAYEVCFVGTGWPSQLIDPLTACGSSDSSEVSPTASAGPAAGMPKTTLCQDILSCFHQTNCTGGIDEDNELQCLCGVGVAISTCESAATPTGACASQIEAGLEVVELSTSVAYTTEPCRAKGAASQIYEICDYYCCSPECFGGRPAPTDDPGTVTYCNAGGSSGSAGAGGASGASGSTGAGGHPGTGGAIQTGGASGSGGVSAGAGGHGGPSGAGGSSGLGGSPGAAGSSGSTQLQNVHFDANINTWTPSVGATASRNTNDADGSMQSGSLDLSLSGGNSTISVQTAATQCLAVTAGASYSLGVKVLIPGQVASQGGLGLWYYTSSDCSGAIAGVFASPASATNAWQSVTATAQIPAGVHSAAVRLVLLKPFGQTSAEALFDDVLVTPQ
jgi:hypothetical protein